MSATRVASRYDRIARRYDLASRLPNLVGFRDRAYHRAAVWLLDPEPGSTVLVLGCGTGIDFATLQEHIGPAGRIIGVDASKGMLDLAAAKCVAAGWTNVVLHQADAQAWLADAPRFDHVLASFCLKFMPDYEALIGACARGLPRHGRFAVADFTLPRWLRTLAWPVRFFGHDAATFGRHPDQAVKRMFAHVEQRRFWFGQAYAIVGSRGDG